MSALISPATQALLMEGGSWKVEQSNNRHASGTMAVICWPASNKHMQQPDDKCAVLMVAPKGLVFYLDRPDAIRG